MENKYYRGFWVIGILTFGIGDLFTTFYGIHVLGAIETNHIPRMILENYGMWVFIPVKIIVIGGLYWLNSYLPKPYNMPCPMLLSLFGMYAIINNTYVMVTLL